jgi:hypothetical protein
MKSRRIAAGTLSFGWLVSGCFGHLTPATATSNIEAPILLGPVDHVGSGPNLQTENVREFESTAKHTASHSESGGYSYDVEISESSVNTEAEYATRGNKYLDIRLTEIKPQAVGVWTGVKARVDLEGQVVKVKPAARPTKGDAK